MLYLKTFASPLGKIHLLANDDHLLSLYWSDPSGVCHPPEHAATAIAHARHPLLVEGERQLCDYFNGYRHTFSLPLHCVGTDFQLRVWRALLTIPYGEVCSYGAIAKRIGQPTASRAVGAANGKNPLPIIVPCHRVVGTNGKLVGYSASGGLTSKTFLLALEKRNCK